MWGSSRPFFLLCALSWGVALGSRQYKAAELTGKSCGEAGLTEEEAAACADPLREETKSKILKHLERRLAVIGRREADAYRGRGPFPHAVFDDMIPRTVLERLVNRRNSRRGGQQWNVQGQGEPSSSEIQCDEARGWHCIKDKKRKPLKMTLADETKMHPVAQGVMAALKSPLFVSFLERVSGISPLTPDPHNEGGGLHETGRGGALQIHADFRRHPFTGWERRVNAFVYLNDDWNATWNGDLELWQRDMAKCAKKIPTIFGRFVMFSSHDFSYHGHAEPLDCPPSRSRKSMAFYYYSPIDRPPETIDGRFNANHSTLYQVDKYLHSPCGTCSDQYNRKLKIGRKCSASQKRSRRSSFIRRRRTLQEANA
mmetsp:Transcript_16352/g.53238  ORF Transcript_16352/g.53238 Transcript_16352/m.53238 type:complete len:370 (+) Transcript_16352:932-2041(+)